jgi:hypothetical protein
MSAPVIVSKKTAGEFKIGEAAYFGMRSFGDDGRVSYKDIKTLIKKGRKWAQWGDSAGYISKKTLLTEMMCVAPPEDEEPVPEKEKEEVIPEEKEESVPEEEEQESWVCSGCCGYFHATRAEYNEYPCCQECLDKLE